MIEVQSVSAAALEGNLQIQIGGQHENSTTADDGDGRVRQSEALKGEIVYYQSACVVYLFHVLDQQLELLPDDSQLLTAEIGQIAHLSQHMRRHVQLAEPGHQTLKEVEILNGEVLCSFEIQNTTPIDGPNQ